MLDDICVLHAVNRYEAEGNIGIGIVDEEHIAAHPHVVGIRGHERHAVGRAKVCVEEVVTFVGIDDVALAPVHLVVEPFVSETDGIALVRLHAVGGSHHHVIATSEASQKVIGLLLGVLSSFNVCLCVIDVFVDGGQGLRRPLARVVAFDAHLHCGLGLGNGLHESRGINEHGHEGGVGSHEGFIVSHCHLVDIECLSHGNGSHQIRIDLAHVLCLAVGILREGIELELADVPVAAVGGGLFGVEAQVLKFGW